MQISHLLRTATQTLSNMSDTPQLDAEILLAHVLKLTRAALYARLNNSVSSAEQQQFQVLINHRQTGEPIAYILGYREFWSLTLAVTPDTLIPRPETELLVELVLQQFPANQTVQIADLGTGSGAIALALAHERPQWLVDATDQSEAGLKVAQRNAEYLKIHNINFYQGNWCAALPAKKYHAIISNPPYIAKNDPHLHQGGVSFEPQTALVAGNDGLTDLQAIIISVYDYLLPDGQLLLEHGYDQGAQVRKLLLVSNYTDIMTYPDLAGMDRVTQGRKI